MIKRSLALILALVLCFGVLAGCQDSGNEGNKGGEGTAVLGGDRNAPLFSEMTEIELYTIENATYDLENNYLDTLLQQQENVNLNVTEGYNLQQMIVDNDLPEIVYSNAIMYGNEYGPKGAFINILEYLDQMPNLKKVLEENTNWTKQLAPDNGLYHVPILQEGNSTPYGFIYRADLFEKHNLTFPTTREEFYNTLKQLKQLYPESYPFVLRQMNGNMQGFMYLTMSFGTELALSGATQTCMNYNHNDEEWYFGPTSEGMKDMISFLAQLYKEGLLHQSTITLTSAQWTEAFAKGDNEKGVSFIGWDKMDRIPAQLQSAGEAMNPEFKLMAGAPIKFNDLGEGAIYQSNPIGSYNFLISGTMKEDQLNKVLTYVDWLYSEEGIETTNWGKEGETFEYDAEGNKKWVDDLLKESDPQYTRGLVFGGGYGVRDWEAYLGWQTETHRANLELANQYATLPTRPTLTYSDDEQTIFDTYYTALLDYARGELQKFITGERSLSTWDAYVDTAESDTYMFNQLMRVHESAYERMQENQPDVEALLKGE